MSAASPKPKDTQSDSGQEPSMEEILASIRRIIADDQAPAPVEEPAPAPSLPPQRLAVEDVLDLASVAKTVRRPPPLSLDPEEVEFRAEPAPPPPPPPPAKPAPAMSAPPAMSVPPARSAPERLQVAVEQETVERLTSKDTDDSVGQAFQLLSSTVLQSKAQTLEDVVKDMLRPMLKSWLDENLPTMVERLVKAEIERVSRGR